MCGLFPCKNHCDTTRTKQSEVIMGTSHETFSCTTEWRVLLFDFGLAQAFQPFRQTSLSAGYFIPLEEQSRNEVLLRNNDFLRNYVNVKLCIMNNTAIPTLHTPISPFGVRCPLFMIHEACNGRRHTRLFGSSSECKLQWSR